MAVHKACKYCGDKISIRQMPAGQWVAFDYASDDVHDCYPAKKKKTGDRTNSGDRKNNNNILEIIDNALENDYDIQMKYYTNYRQEWTNRRVTPVSITRKNGSTYMRAYCQWREEERNFSVSNIESAYLVHTLVKPPTTPEPRPVPEETIPVVKQQSESNLYTYAVIVFIILIIIYFVSVD